VSGFAWAVVALWVRNGRDVFGRRPIISGPPPGRAARPRLDRPARRPSPVIEREPGGHAGGGVDGGNRGDRGTRKKSLRSDGRFCVAPGRWNRRGERTVELAWNASNGGCHGELDERKTV
jgi:hypothetical protein